MNYFSFSKRPDAQWLDVGLASSFPDIDLDGDNVAQPRMCNSKVQPGCKVFQVPKEDPTQIKELLVRSDGGETSMVEGSWKDQVLVFQYKGKFHAVDHVSVQRTQYLGVLG